MALYQDYEITIPYQSDTNLYYKNIVNEVAKGIADALGYTVTREVQKQVSSTDYAEITIRGEHTIRITSASSNYITLGYYQGNIRQNNVYDFYGSYQAYLSVTYVFKKYFVKLGNCLILGVNSNKGVLIISECSYSNIATKIKDTFFVFSNLLSQNYGYSLTTKIQYSFAYTTGFVTKDNAKVIMRKLSAFPYGSTAVGTVSHLADIIYVAGYVKVSKVGDINVIGGKPYVALQVESAKYVLCELAET